MNQAGFGWTINQVGETWTWAVTAPGDTTALVAGQAPSRAAAAAMVVRALVRGMTEAAHRELAA